MAYHQIKPPDLVVDAYRRDCAEAGHEPVCETHQAEIDAYLRRHEEKVRRLT